MVEVVLNPEAQKQIAGLTLTIRARVLAVVERLAQWPAVSGAKPLRGKLAGHYRVRTGDYRIQFYLVGETLVIEKVGHRDGFYEE